MQITPRYDGPPVLRIEGAGDVATPMVRQRTRLLELLDGLDERQWASPTRCDGWSVQDVVSHLVGTNQFWALSLAQGLAGDPTRYLVGFDPVATPARMVDADRARPPSAPLDALRASDEALLAAVRSVEGEGWDALAEAPPGHVPVTCLLLHALWDAWVHERDVALPLGLQPPVEDDEVLASLRYVAALGPGFRAMAGAPLSGRVGIVTTDPAAGLVVELGDTVVVRDGSVAEDEPVVVGDAVTVVEALSVRGPFPEGTGDDARACFAGIVEVFDQA